MFLSSLGSAGSKATVAPVYLDLAYLPSGSAAPSVDVEFFRRLRSSSYIVSGDDPVKEAVMRTILDALLEGKTAWPDVQVAVQPDSNPQTQTLSQDDKMYRI